MSTLTPADVSCPAWCTQTPAQHLEQQRHPDDAILHRGAELGHFEFWQMEGDPPTVTFIKGFDDNTDLTAAQVRKLAQDALAAAEWLEAHGG